MFLQDLWNTLKNSSATETTYCQKIASLKPQNKTPNQEKHI